MDEKKAPQQDAKQNQHDKFITFSEKSHRGLAEFFLKSFTQSWTPGLISWRGDWYRWLNYDRKWHGTEETVVRKLLFAWLDKAPILTKNGEKVPATAGLLDNIFKIVQLLAHQPSAIDAPFELSKSNPPESLQRGRFAILESGILNLETREEAGPFQSVFAPNVLPFYFEPDAECPEWLGFLASLWPDDPESVRLLQQWAGYLISGDTSKQKILFLLGPPRSGKGTILRVLTSLLGNENVAAFSLAALGGDFGLANIANKTMASCPDARLSGRTDQDAIVERLLSVSGEDTVPVNRKYKNETSQKIPARLILASNEMPRLTDVSGALVSRLLILRMTETFLGREDLKLTDKLIAEMPGILNWALTGLDDLNECGHFTEPSSSSETRDNAERLSSPVLAFVRDTCIVGPHYRVQKRNLYEAWQTWTHAAGHMSGSDVVFSRNLSAAFAGISSDRPERERGSANRPTFWIGIGLSVRDYEESRQSRQSSVGHPSVIRPSENPASQPPSVMSVISGKDSLERKEEEERYRERINNREKCLTCPTDQHQSQKMPDGMPDGCLTGHLTATANINDIPIEEEA